ncbi:MAG: transposase [Burkholderiales bacterium]|jgi:putative transposase|nr:transposase [Burkholderiales bacterium]
MPRYIRSFVPGGTFFFTVTSENRSSTLLTDEIEMLRRAYKRVKNELPFETIAVCILPDHLHSIWTLPQDDGDYAKRWQQIKRSFSLGLPSASGRSPSKARQREKGIWQRRYWEHQIRDEIDLLRHTDYIHFNPVKHGLVKRVKDWPFSSLFRYVREGGLPEDWAEEPEKEGLFGE